MEFAVALGFMGLGMLGLQFLFSGRFVWVAPWFGMDNSIQYHREVGIIAFIFILAHPVILILTKKYPDIRKALLLYANSN